MWSCRKFNIQIFFVWRHRFVLQKVCAEKFVRKIKNSPKNQDGIPYGVLIEKTGINLVKKICNEKLEIIKTGESYLCDLVIRPINSNSDIWLSVQLKVSDSETFNFNISNDKLKCDKYKAMILLFVYVTQQKIWILERIEPDVTHIEIGKKSKYNKYKVNNLCDELTKWYNLKTYNFPFDIINEPSSQETLTERKFAQKRKNYVNFVDFISNEYDGLAYDFKICGYIKTRRYSK